MAMYIYEDIEAEQEIYNKLFKTKDKFDQMILSLRRLEKTFEFQVAAADDEKFAYKVYDNWFFHRRAYLKPKLTHKQLLEADNLRDGFDRDVTNLLLKYNNQFVPPWYAFKWATEAGLLRVCESVWFIFKVEFGWPSNNWGLAYNVKYGDVYNWPNGLKFYKTACFVKKSKNWIDLQTRRILYEVMFRPQPVDMKRVNKKRKLVEMARVMATEERVEEPLLEEGL